jgi:hypothetical protein
MKGGTGECVSINHGERATTMSRKAVNRRSFVAHSTAALAWATWDGAAVLADEKKAPRDRPDGSALAQLAAKLKPGAWAVLNKDGDDSGYGSKLTDSGIGTLFGYASKAAYDPVRRRVFFFGSGHHNQATPEHYAEIIKFIVYEVDTNRWTRLKTPQWYLDTGTKGGNSHGYQYQTVAKGQFFRASLGPPARKSTVQVCNVDRDKIVNIDPKNDWKESVDVPFTFSVGPLEYFPDRNSLVTINTRAGEVHERELDSPKWVKLAKADGMIYFGIAASYNPVHKAVVFGGGSQAAPPWTNVRKWHLLDARGKVSPLDDSPVDSYAATSTLFTVDPVSGKHLLISPNDFDFKKTNGFWFYELDITRKTGSQWSRRQDLEAAVPQFNSRSPNHVFATVVVPLPEYRVNLFMGPANVWIYKHDAKGASGEQTGGKP